MAGLAWHCLASRSVKNRLQGGGEPAYPRGPFAF